MSFITFEIDKYRTEVISYESLLFRGSNGPF